MLLCFEEKHTVTMRDCVVDSGGLNSDSEIGRQSHCWYVSELKFDGKKMFGCSVACDRDGCNHGNRLRSCVDYGVLTGVVMLYWFLW